MIPAMSRLSSAALTATRASWSAVAAPAETASTVVAPRVVSDTSGARPSTTATITIPIIADQVNENVESFFISLTNAVNAVINDSSATGTIFDDDNR